MTDDREQSDYSELLRSPYDPAPGHPDREEGSSDLSWKPAVIAAILGALTVGAFVIYAAATSEDPTDEAVVQSSTTTVAAVESPLVPPGYVLITDEVGAQVEGVAVSSTSTVMGISTAVAGAFDAGESTPVDVAYWELENAGSTVLMTSQYAHLGALGNVTVEFQPIAAIRQSELLAYVADGTDHGVHELEIVGEVPQEISDVRIDMGNGNAVIVNVLVVGDGWGWVSWHTQGPMPARVDTVVTFVGTDDPSTPELDETTLSNAHLRRIAGGTGPRTSPPLFGFEASQQLVRSGEPLGLTNPYESIHVSFSVTIPQAVNEPVRIPVPSGS